MDTAAEKNVIVPLQINTCAKCLEYMVVKPPQMLNILTWPSGSLVMYAKYQINKKKRKIKKKKKKEDVTFKHKGYGMKEEKARQQKKNVGTFIVHDVMEEKILWNNSMSKGSSVSPTSSYLDFVSVCYNSIVNYNNCIS